MPFCGIVFRFSIFFFSSLQKSFQICDELQIKYLEVNKIIELEVLRLHAFNNYTHLESNKVVL